VIPAPPHPREEQRLRSLRGLLAVGASDERVLETLTSLACRLLDMPVAMINVVDESTSHTVAATGLDIRSLHRDEAMCGWTVATDGFLSVPDLMADPRFHDGVVTASGLRSYHGSPVAAPDGLPLGALCVLDHRPRVLGAEQRLLLQELAEVAAAHVELVLRRAADARARPAQLPPAPRPGAAADVQGPAAGDDPDEPRGTEHPPDLVAGLAAGEVIPFFQPIVSLEDGRVVGVEALARWEHPGLGLLAPASFLADAEAGDTVIGLDATILEEACHQVQVWRSTRAEAADLELSVNISGRHLAGRGLVALVSGALERSGLPAHALTLELTETVLVEAGRTDGSGRAEGSLDCLEELRRLGVGLALDDFGTAYSALTYLRRFPVTRLKVDRSFVAGLDDGPRDALLVESVLQLASRLDLDVVAEGVETPEQLRVLRGLGCARAQGYHFLPPVSAEELELTGMLGTRTSGRSLLYFPRPA
jgi:EAL domain-containing protein (putative c-di-GMP-specific phosphodiesterase class I)